MFGDSLLEAGAAIVAAARCHGWMRLYFTSFGGGQAVHEVGRGFLIQYSSNSSSTFL